VVLQSAPVRPQGSVKHRALFVSRSQHEPGNRQGTKRPAEKANIQQENRSKYPTGKQENKKKTEQE
jgi:hypothetical protein